MSKSISKDRAELEEEFSRAVHDVESRKRLAGEGEYAPTYHRIFTPGEQRRVDLIDIENFPEDYEGETVQESLKRLELKRRHLNDPIPASNPRLPVHNIGHDVKWSKRFNRPKQSGANFGNIGNPRGSRRKSMVNHKGLGEILCDLFTRNEEIRVPSAKLTDDEIVERISSHYPDGRNRAGRPFTLLDVKMFRYRFNRGMLYPQLCVLDENGHSMRLAAARNPPRVKSRRYVRTADGRVYVTSESGRKLIPYLFAKPSPSR